MLSKNLPSHSPLDKRWPRCSPMYRRTSMILRKMYHQWRVGVRRNYLCSNLLPLLFSLLPFFHPPSFCSLLLSLLPSFLTSFLPPSFVLFLSILYSTHSFLSSYLFFYPILFFFPVQKCKLLRSHYQANPRDRRKMLEKARASSVFKGKKVTYSRT